MDFVEGSGRCAAHVLSPRHVVDVFLSKKVSEKPDQAYFAFFSAGFLVAFLPHDFRTVFFLCVFFEAK